MTTKPRGRGVVKALVFGPLKKYFFCGFPNYTGGNTTINTFIVSRSLAIMLFRQSYDSDSVVKGPVKNKFIY